MRSVRFSKVLVNLYPLEDVPVRYAAATFRRNKRSCVTQRISRPWYIPAVLPALLFWAPPFSLSPPLSSSAPAPLPAWTLLTHTHPPSPQRVSGSAGPSGQLYVILEDTLRHTCREPSVFCLLLLPQPHTGCSCVSCHFLLQRMLWSWFLSDPLTCEVLGCKD